MKKAAIYARFSSEGQREASIDDQVRNCIKLIDGHGWEIAGVYSDRAISGATTLRPDLQRLLSDARKQAFDVVVAEALDRLSRDQEATAGLYKLMTFLGIAIVTRAEGEVSELHVGLKGTMNALFLKDLALKTHRGIEGRVRKGRHGGGRYPYGYRAVRAWTDADEDVRGLRVVDPAQAEIVRRIFREFAAGRSPHAIARDLNAEGIVGPSGKAWLDTSIRGQANRRTGILRNDLYAGRLVWNKQTYVREPSTGKRLARIRDPEQRVETEVPDLRIVDQELWEAVQERFNRLRAAARESAKGDRWEFWKQRRPKHLFTGLIHCGKCGSPMTAIGKDYLACGASRCGGACTNRAGVRRRRIEEVVLEALKTRLMAPELVEEFILSFHEELNRRRAADDLQREEHKTELDRITKKLRGIYDAIAEGFRSPGLQDEVLALEAKQAELKRAIEAAPPPAPRFHPRLAELYREQVNELHVALNDPGARTEAATILRGLIDRISVIKGEKGFELELTGNIVKLVGLPGGEVPASFESSVRVVAGRRRLRARQPQSLRACRSEAQAAASPR
jgi:DNA invertase Pin-like site-specific DNA recombinase